MNELNLCHYCGSLAIQSTHADINIVGEKGFKSMARCTLCHNMIERWAETYAEAERQALYDWNEWRDGSK